jgi:RNA polymerase sigma-70 factor (ECF subfamily)
MLNSSLDFEEVYHHHKRMVYNLALQYVQNAEDAEEISQDVFVGVYHALDSFRYESAIATWIYRITINKSIDYIKAAKRKKRFAFITSLFAEGSGALAHELFEFNHPGVQLEYKEAVASIFMQINALPNQQKTALILHKIEHKSQVEIAEIMEISPKAVESLIQRAKINLAKKLGAREG